MKFLATLACVLFLTCGTLFAQPPREASTAAQFDTTEAPPQATQLEQLYDALFRLPLAAGLASVLALRPRRRGTPQRQPPSSRPRSSWPSSARSS